MYHTSHRKRWLQMDNGRKLRTREVIRVQRMIDSLATTFRRSRSALRPSTSDMQACVRQHSVWKLCVSVSSSSSGLLYSAPIRLQAPLSTLACVNSSWENVSASDASTSRSSPLDERPRPERSTPAISRASLRASANPV
ncbi:hypothetical protein EYF80_037913 [Liparis tanakae]|uniref:Uncharacterized protein n=1 Tax=Liparis tanakae TaxID=230148 RepID=A0A4Z2GEF0_9TELE|nr:hypothetical protein EYF80_037913 [Liparis tanakae]